MSNNEFDPNPKFENHMCHWQPWAEKFKDAPGEAGVLARMLGYSLAESERLLHLLAIRGDKYEALFWAYIETVENIERKHWWQRLLGVIVTPVVDGTGSWRLLQVLNRWRSENKRNIKEWDV